MNAVEDTRIDVPIWPRMVVLLLALLSAISFSIDTMGQSPVNQRGHGDKRPSLMEQPADVVIFVKPLTADSASIGVAYNKLNSQQAVKADLRALFANTGWKYGGDLVINNASIHPDRPKQYPATTAAMLTVTHAPQVRDGAPELLPYLRAYHAYTHVEVNFALPDLEPYTGAPDFANDALTVELHKDQGVYRYETEIRDHKRPLPELPATPAMWSNLVLDGTPIHGPELYGGAIHNGTRDRANKYLRVAALFLGVALISAGCGNYILSSRRTTKSLRPRSTLRG